MSRTSRYKLGYCLALGALAVLAVLAVLGMGGRVPAMAAVAIFALIPGRVQALLYRELFRGRRLLDAGQAAEAAKCFESFRRTLREKPGLKRFIWLSWTVYTPDVEAIAANNLGSAQLRLGRLREAEAAFREALEMDPLYPLPHFNLAIVHELQGDRAGAETAAGTAARLGYSQSRVDLAVHAAQSLLATIEGRGASST